MTSNVMITCFRRCCGAVQQWLRPL